MTEDRYGDHDNHDNLSDEDSSDEELLSFLPSSSSSTDEHCSNIRIRQEDNTKAAASSRRIAIFLFLVGSILALVWWNTEKKEKTGVKDVDYTNTNNKPPVKQWNDLKLKDIQHWCLDATKKKCPCINPLVPVPRMGHKRWMSAHSLNVRDAENRNDAANKHVDVVFLGDSITEGWKGTSYGKPFDRTMENFSVFQSLFVKQKGGTFEGLPLGISGDRSPNLLWRIQNGEVPSSLHPKVFWILIGTNDFLNDKSNHCSDEVVFMGIKRVVEEMRIIRPNTKIVVNGLLPRGDLDLDGKLVDPEHPTRHTIWDAIQDVNKKLEDYCSKHENLVYFDAREVFVRSEERLSSGVEKQYIPRELMEDFLHPTAQGYRNWGKRIVKTLDTLID